MSQQCKCTISINVLSDGCRHCQPQKFIETLNHIITEMGKEIEELEQELRDRPV